MRIKRSPLVFLFFSLGLICGLNAQTKDFAEKLYKNYDRFRESSIDQRRFKHSQIMPLIEGLRENSEFSVNEVGESIEGRSLNLVSLGEGNVDVLLWSQMHGDESTATMAIMDIFNFFESDGFNKEKSLILQKLRIHFLPMLNPDGAEKFRRRNALGVDINRDAVRLQSPESKTLKRVRDSLEADFGFNLHDQSRYYNAERTSKPATISFLAPAFNYEKDINEVRGRAMKLIVSMNEVLQGFAPGQVGRYNDDFEPRAFGDNIQKWGTSTVLIESGGYQDDREKQEIRKLNFVSILSALYAIASEEYKQEDLAAYGGIPENDRKLFDLKLKALNYELDGNKYVLDLGIDRNEFDLNENTGFYYSSNISDQGDLSTSYGYDSLDASNYSFDFGKIYPEVFENLSAFESMDFASLLQQGYAYIKVKDLPEDKSYSNYPVNLVSPDFKINKELRPGSKATFLLMKNGEVAYVVINGFLWKPGDRLSEIKNSLILK